MKKLTLLLLSLLLIAGFAGCGQTGQDEGGVKRLNYNIGYDPDTFDPQACNNLENNVILTQIYDTLLRENLNGVFEPSLAESYTVSEDGLVYTFILKEGLKFADGSPLTTEDVIYSWARALDPANAFEYAYQLYYIKNGESYNMGNASASDLGLKAVDARTLEVTLENPAPYFASLTGFGTYGVISKAFAEAQATYGADLDSTLASGPFMPAEWVKEQYLKVVKNPNYWDAATVKIDELYIYAVSESATEIQMYETGQLDITSRSMSTADQKRLAEEGVLQIRGNLSNRYIMVNNTHEAINDVRVRKALCLALDRESIAVNVVNNATAIGGFIPNKMAAVDDPSKLFRTEDLIPANGDLEQAKALLADAGYPEGKGFPVLEMLYTTNEANKALAEALAEMWRTNLGIEVKAVNLEGAVRRERKDSGDFDFSLDGWSTDYMDPYSFLELALSNNAYNEGQYSNPEYDALLKTAKSSNDQTVRQNAMAAAEKILIEDMGVIPLYVSQGSYLQKDNVINVYYSLMGGTDFKWAEIK